jgi:hypothetical protein
VQCLLEAGELCVPLTFAAEHIFLASLRLAEWLGRAVWTSAGTQTTHTTVPLLNTNCNSACECKLQMQLLCYVVLGRDLHQPLCWLTALAGQQIGSAWLLPARQVRTLWKGCTDQVEGSRSGRHSLPLNDRLNECLHLLRSFTGEGHVGRPRSLPLTQCCCCCHKVR